MSGILHIASPLDACSPLKNHFSKEESLPPFVLISRGTCNFDRKVKNAQDAGFQGAIVYNSMDSFDELVTSKPLRQNHLSLVLKVVFTFGIQFPCYWTSMCTEPSKDLALMTFSAMRDLYSCGLSKFLILAENYYYLTVLMPIVHEAFVPTAFVISFCSVWLS